MSISYTNIQHTAIKHENKDYPVAVFYVEPSKMYMGNVSWQWHEEFEFDYIKEGEAIFHIGKSSYTVSEGEAVFINSNIFHSITESENGSKCVILSALVNPKFLFHEKGSSLSQTYLSPIGGSNDFRFRKFSRSSFRDRGIVSYIEELISINFSRELGFELESRSILDNIWLQFIREVKISPIKGRNYEKEMSVDELRIKDAITYIENHYFEAITLEDIADSIHVSKSECCRCFKRAVSMTPFEYLMKFRIFKAADTILQNKRDPIPISELAFDVGFNNTSYFNKRFKDYFGCTPTEFRKNSKTEHRDTLSPYGLSLSHF